MDTLPIPIHPALTVFCGGSLEPVAQALAELALRGPLTVLDGGNRFPAYRLIRLLHGRLPDPTRALAHTFVRRAFTCYQMLALLESTPAWSQPCIVLDLLATFYDEQVAEHEIRRLLANCLNETERLARPAPLLVTVTPPPTAGRAFLVEQVCARAGQLYLPRLPIRQPAQSALF